MTAVPMRPRAAPFRRAIAWAVLALAPLAATPAGAFELRWPAACTDGTDCFVQNYVDHQDSDRARDFTCGPLSYPGHDGTDIRLKNLAAMRAGVAVLAPADGTVLRVRDGMADQNIRTAAGGVDVAIAALDGRDCGNGVVIEHADGYETQFCHLKQGSVRVRPGEVVTAGTPIGAIGLSGRTEFPHVHMTLTRDGRKLDPFTGSDIGTACGQSDGAALWSDAHPYRATALLGDGFTDAAPDAAVMRDQPVSLTTLATGSGALVYWVDLMGLRTGDRLRLRITAPDGSTLVENETPIPGPKAQYFAFVGKRLGTPLAPGDYAAELVLLRDIGIGPEVITRSTRSIHVN